MEEKKSNAGLGLGIAGLVLGIIALIISFIPCLGVYAVIPGVIAIVLSVFAFMQAKKANASKGLIIAALVISIVGTTIAVIWGLVLSKGVSAAKSVIEQMDTKAMEDVTAALKPFETGQPVADADFNKFVASYESFITEAAKLKEKAKGSDMAAISAAAAFVPVGLKFAEIALKLENAKSNLTPEQVQKLDDLNKKFEKEMEELKK
jgi:hypothetical protein